jgi:hypothetical protein
MISQFDLVRITALAKPEPPYEEDGEREPRVGDVAVVVQILENPRQYYLECYSRKGPMVWSRVFSANAASLEVVGNAANGGAGAV